jgi:hypothetical protein
VRAAAAKAAAEATEAEPARAPAPARTTRAVASAVALQAAAEPAAEAAALECEGHASPRAPASAMKSSAASRPPTPVAPAPSYLRSLSLVHNQISRSLPLAPCEALTVAVLPLGNRPTPPRRCGQDAHVCGGGGNWSPDRRSSAGAETGARGTGVDQRVGTGARG